MLPAEDYTKYGGLNILRCDQVDLWPVSPDDTQFILFKNGKVRLWKDSMRLYLNTIAKRACRDGREVALAFHIEQLTQFKKLTFFDESTKQLSRKFKKKL